MTSSIPARPRTPGGPSLTHLRVGIAAGALLAAAAGPSCLALDGFSDLEPAEAAGGSTGVGSTSTATTSSAGSTTSTDGAGGGAGGGSSTGGGGEGGGPSGRVRVYVSPLGSDELGDGLSPEQPRLTIQGALDVLDDLGAEGDVRICEGTYAVDAIEIARSISILGGFDCDTWDRPPAAPTTPEDVQRYFAREVEILGRPGGPALTLDGPAVDGSVLVEGVIVRGGRVAVDVVGGAAPRIEKTVLAGGGEESGPAIALRVDGSPRLDQVTLRGGNGTSDGTLPGSAGMVLLAGEPVLEEAYATGGVGAAADEGLASAGLLVLGGQLTGVSALRSVRLSGGQGSSTSTDVTTAGLAILGGDVAVEGAVIGGGKPATATSGSVGVLVETSGHVSIARSAVNGGTSLPTTTSRAVHARAAASLTVENCAITGGLFLSEGAAIDVATIGVHVDGREADAVGVVEILHSTIQAQHVQPAGAPRSAGPIVVGRGGPVTIGNNLLFTAEADTDVVALRYTACPTEGAIAGNAFFWIPRLLTDEACTADVRGASNIASLESMFDEPFAAEGNVYVGACADESPTCDALPCAGPEACLGTVFAGNSLSAAFLLGFSLKSDGSAPCSIVESPVDYGVGVDWSGQARDVPPSRGADEVAACTP